MDSYSCSQRLEKRCAALAGRKALLATAVMAASATADSAYDFTVTDIDGKKIDLSQYRGKVVLVVNVASQCGRFQRTPRRAKSDTSVQL